MTTVLLTGTYSSHNKGDLAMQLTAARLLRARGVEVVSSVPFPEIDAAAYAAAGVAVVPSNRRRIIRATWQLARLVLWRALKRGPGWLVFDKNLDPFREADLILDLSGDMLTEDYGPHVAYSHFVPLLNALLLDRPLVLLAQSIGPFRIMKPLAKAILRRATLITVRDPVSKAYLEELGVTSPTLTADLAFALEPSSLSTTDARWDALDIGKERPILGVSISALAAARGARRGADFYADVAAALDAFAQGHDAMIIFFPHVTGPSRNKDDRIAAEQVRNLMNEGSRAVREDLSPGEVKALIGRTTWFMGCRMHANIAALSSRVPTLAVSYSHKTPGIMRRLGLEQYVLDVSDVTPDTVLNSLDSLVSSSLTITAHLAEVLPEVEIAAARNIDMVLDRLARTTI